MCSVHVWLIVFIISLEFAVDVLIVMILLPFFLSVPFYSKIDPFFLSPPQVLIIFNLILIIFYDIIETHQNIMLQLVPGLCSVEKISKTVISTVEQEQPFNFSALLFSGNILRKKKTFWTPELTSPITKETAIHTSHNYTYWLIHVKCVWR